MKIVINYDGLYCLDSWGPPRRSHTPRSVHSEVFSFRCVGGRTRPLCGETTGGCWETSNSSFMNMFCGVAKKGCSDIRGFRCIL